MTAETAPRSLIDRIDHMVRARGEPLEGNICYHHHAHGLCWAPELERKRQRWQVTAASVSLCVEIGVNAGHSAVLALAANPRLTYWGIDPCEHSYTVDCWQLIAQTWPDRAVLIQQPSPAGLQLLPPRSRGRCLWSIDGDHSQDAAQADIRAVSERALQGDLMWIDDCDSKSVSRAIKHCVDDQWREQRSLAATVRLFKRR